MPNLGEVQDKIRKDKKDRETIVQLRSELLVDIKGLREMTEEMKDLNKPKDHLEALAEFKESFMNSCRRKILEITPLLEAERELYKTDFERTKNKYSDEQETLDYLATQIKEIDETLAEYKSVLEIS